MGSRFAYIEQNREKFNIKIPQKFLGVKGGFFQKSPLAGAGQCPAALLHRLMERTRDDFALLLAGELAEVDGIAGDADGQVGVVLGMLVGVH